MISKNTALIIIDVQNGFDEPYWGVRNNLNAEDNMGKLLRAWRKHHFPVFHVKHNSTELSSPLRPERPGNAIKSLVKPLKREPLFIKNVNSAFIGTDLEKALKEKKIRDLVIVGLTTDHCVSTTTRMGANLGFSCTVVSDATATFNRNGYNGKNYTGQEMHEMALVSLQNEFASILDTMSVLKKLR